MKVGLDLDLESLAGDLDLSDLQYLLTQDSSGDEVLASPVPTVTQNEEEERVVDLRDYGPNAEIDTENPDDLKFHHTMCKRSIDSYYLMFMFKLWVPYFFSSLLFTYCDRCS